jgi:dolichyl-phosphate-mannose--protein O-mannosyl transferase
VALAFLLLAGLLRTWGAFDVAVHLGDEYFHVPSAINLARYGVPLTSNWTHPPVGALILGGAIGVFGDNPLGWRVGGIVFGSASVALLFVLAQRLTRSRTAGALAAALLALDPFHVYFSRTTFMEIPGLCFFLLFLWALHVFHDDRKGWALPVAGLAMGLTAATKAYFAASFLLASAYVLQAAWKRREDRLELALQAGCCLVLLPTAVYLGSFFHFFAGGHSLAEFLRMRGDAFWSLRTLTAASFENQWLLEVSGRPWEWFVRPLFSGVKLEGTGGTSRYLLELNNFPIRPLALAALAYLTVRGARERSPPFLLAPLLFASVYVPFLVLSRPVLGYSALVLLPFAYLALGWSIVLLERRHLRMRRASVAALVLIALWGAYLYPLATGKAVVEELYGPILSHTRLQGMPQ